MRLSPFALLPFACLSIFPAPPAFANPAAGVRADEAQLARAGDREAAGLEPESALPPAPAAAASRSPEAHRRALELLGTRGLLLIPESTNDRVMAFDPVSGDLVDADFVPADPTHLNTPIHAVLNTCTVPTILISDQLNDAVLAYDLDGIYLGVFAPAGGVNLAILDNVRGIWARQGYVFLVTVGAGPNDDAVAGFYPQSGASVGNFISNGAAGLASPFAIHVRFDLADILVGGSDSDIIHRFDFAGAPLPDLAPILNFPEQIATAGNGNVLVADFLGTQTGVVELSPAGVLIDVHTAPGVSGNRGVYELPGGTILTTTADGVFEIDRAGNLVDTKIASVGARFIEFVQVDPDLIFKDGFEIGLVSICWVSVL